MQDLNCSDGVLNRNCYKQGIQKLRNRKSVALPSTLSLVTGSAMKRAISTALIIVEKITKKARSLSRRLPSAQESQHLVYIGGHFGEHVSAPVRKHMSYAALINISRYGFGRASTRGRGCGI
jgi:hypothetical protein